MTGGAELPLAGKVAVVTGAARGQGRSHAIGLARDGADIVALDRCANIDSLPYNLATPPDLQETARLVEATGRRILTFEVDVRDQAGLSKAIRDTVATFGRLDIVCANAGVTAYGGRAWEVSDEEWEDVIGVDLTGVWRTMKACIPAMIDAGHRGSIILTSSTGGSKGILRHVHYVAAKHGVIGLMRTLAQELAPYGIRANAVQPTAVDTAMIHNPAEYALFRPDLKDPTREDVSPVFRSNNLLDVPWVQPADVTAAVRWLASDEARFVTGICLPVDAGTMARY